MSGPGAFSDFVYNGGPVINTPQVHILFVGNWADADGQNRRSRLTRFVGDLLNSRYMNILSQYGCGTTGSVASTTTVAAPDTDLSGTDIHGIIQTAVDNGQIPEPTDQATCVLMYLDDATAVNDPGTGVIMCEATSDDAFGFHDHFVTRAGNTYPFAVVPGLTDACLKSSCPSDSRCSLHLAATQEQRQTQVTSHELSEMFSNPQVDSNEAWSRPGSPHENGDICNGKSATITVGSDTWTVQLMYSKFDDMRTNGATTCIADSDPLPSLLPHHLNDDQHMKWLGDFTGSGRTEVLFWASDGNWWLGTYSGTELHWTMVGNPGWFNLNDDHHMNWTGDFTGSGKTEVLFWAADGNWWLGTCSGNELHWTMVGNPGWFTLNDGQHMNWLGDFTGSGRTEVLFWASDGNWWLGSYSGGALNWSMVGNPGWFNLNDDQHMNWIGNFTGSGKTEVLFWAADGNWWLGSYSGGALNWSFVGNPGWFTLNDDQHMNWLGDFTGSGRTEVLFWASDGNWWLGSYSGGALNWSFVGNPGWSNLNDDQHMNWIGNFTGSGRTEVLFWASDGNWWLGTYSGGALNWSMVGNPGWHSLNDDQHMNWIGNFTGSGRTEELFWASDGNWWLGTYSGGALTWSMVGNPGW